ncbi:hypothetical protein [Asticcacaulis benevestitus]|uniref:hypothetical protein n=1 Tax=Asticcacaulis benevestitus TaxID=347481 RepID=UPI0003AB0E81|nr:hypothetical protein [Asticcacaulis benevestitus]
MSFQGLWLQGLWHSAKVVSAGLYWLLSLAFLWGGFVQMGYPGMAGEVCIAFVICLFLLRFILVKRFVAASVFNVAATVVFFIFIAILQAKGMTGVA